MILVFLAQRVIRLTLMNMRLCESALRQVFAEAHYLLNDAGSRALLWLHAKVAWQRLIRALRASGQDYRPMRY
jgi:hypothetical protein